MIIEYYGVITLQIRQAVKRTPDYSIIIEEHRRKLR